MPGADLQSNGSAAVRCPRCGYDQRGIIATWADACPLDGRCTECGLRFAWAEVIVPAKFEPKWCLEFVPRRRFVAASLQTLLRSLMPVRFWSQMSMSFPVRWRRLAAYTMLLLAITSMPYVLFQASLAVYVRYSVARDVAQLPVHAATQRRRMFNVFQSNTYRQQLQSLSD